MKKTFKKLVDIFLLLSKPLGLIKYVFLMPLVLQGQTPPHSGVHCAKDDYPDVSAKLFALGPSNDTEGRKLEYRLYMVPCDKVTAAGKGFLVSHPGYSDECKEETSTVTDDATNSIYRALKHPFGKFVIISLTTRDDVPDKEWRFVLVF